MIKITEEKRKQAIKWYKDKEKTIPEIANLLGVSVSYLTVIFRKALENGEIQPRRPEIALKPRVPNGQGKGVYVKKGYGVRKKFTDEQESQIAIDYFENNMKWKEIEEKWNVSVATIQRILKEHREVYGRKPKGFAYEIIKQKEKEIVELEKALELACTQIFIDSNITDMMFEHWDGDDQTLIENTINHFKTKAKEMIENE